MLRTILGIIAAIILSLLFTHTLPCLAAEGDSPAFDQPPAPVGGMAAIMQQVVYPKAAKKDGLEGKVLVSVVIDAAGHSQKVEVTQGVRADLDQAAVKALKATTWIPAQKDGKSVESTVVVPIQFKLEQKAKK